MLVLAALSLVPRFLLGFLVMELAWRARTKSHVVELFLAGPLGVGLSSLLSFLWIWMRLDLHLYAATEATLILLVFVFWASQRIRPNSPTWRNLRYALPARGRGWWVCLGVAAVIFCAQFWTMSLQSPHGGWDAWVHWNVVSRFVFRGGARWQATFLRVFDQPDYPLLMAMTNASTWELVQNDTTRGPMVLAFMFTVSLVGLLFGLVKELRGSSQACLVAIVLLAQPLLVENGISQYADIPEACYFLASVALTLVYIRSRDSSLAVLAGLTAGLGAWTKNEGSVFAATSLVAWAYLSWRERGSAFKGFVLGAAGPLAVLALFKGYLAPSSDVLSNSRASLAAIVDPARYLVVLGEAAVSFWRQTAESSALLLVLAVYGGIIGRTKQRIAGLPYLLWIFATQSAAYFLVYVGTPFAGGSAAMIPTNIGRLYMHVLPLALAAWFLWLKSPDDLRLPANANGRVSGELANQ